MKNKLIYWCVFITLVLLCLPVTAFAADNQVGVAYRGHIQDLGDYPTDGSWLDSPEIIGTEGQSKRIEGFEIKLTGTVLDGMEMRYNVHIQNKGWLYDENDSTNWPKDGEYAGTRGESLRIEAVKIVLTDNSGKPVTGYSVQYRGHVQNVGDLPVNETEWIKDGDQLGTVGSSLRLEALLVQVVKTQPDPVQPVVYDAAGIYGSATEPETIAGDVTVAADGVTLQNLVIEGNLTVSEGVGNGTVTLNNVTVKGDTFVRGGGINSIHINGGQYSRIIMEKTASGAVRIVATSVDGLAVIISEDAAGETIVLEGAFDSIEVNAPNMTVTTQGNTTTIGKVTVGKEAAGTTLNLNSGTTVTDLALNGTAAVKGQGTVTRAVINADRVVFEKAPSSYTVAANLVIPPVFPTPNNGGGGYTPPKPVSVIGVSLDQATLDLVYHDTASLTATVAPVEATNKAISWSSDNTAVVTVSITGLVTAIAAGTATVTATTTDGNFIASCEVTVQGRLSIYDFKAVAGIDDDNYVAVLLEGDSFQSSSVNFNPGDTGLVLSPSTHDSEHYVFSLINTPKSGTLTLQATDLASGINSTTASIAVLPAVTAFAKTATTDATVGFSWPALNGATAVTLQQQKSGETSWSEATCSVTPNSASTTATVTGLTPATTYSFRLLVIGGATPGVSNLVTVTTKPVATSVSLNKSTADLTMGYFLMLYATVLPADAGNKTISWSSNDQLIASVDQNGQVTPVAQGTAVITATTANNLTATCTVTVKPLFVATTSGSTASIDSYNGTNTSVDIPAEIDGKPVTSIGANAFNGKTMIQSVTIPATVTSIGANAFKDTNLTTVAIPAVSSIGDGAFLDCDQLTTLSFDSSATLTTIAPKTFQGCRKLTGVAFPDSVKTLGNGAFMQCFALTSINLNQVESLGENAFYMCSALTNLAIPNTLTSIGNQAFLGCTSLKTVNVAGGANALNLAGNTFSGCTALETVTFAADATISTIGFSVFNGCSKLSSVTLPPSLTVIPNNTFLNCTSLASITIPTTVTSIGAYAFQNNAALTAVTIPGSVTTIGEGAFYDCITLATVDFPASGSALTIGRKAFYSEDSLTNIDLPARLQKIEEGAFHNCKNLTAVNFAGGCQLTSIGKDGFSECPITSLTLPALLQTITEYSFYNNKLSGTLVIPAAVTAIGGNAFEGDTAGASLTALEIKSTAASNIGAMAFKHHPLITITMPANVSISADVETMGTNGSGFQAAYTAGSNGTYTYSSGWIK